MTALPGYVLAGGASFRFGRDKAREVVLGAPLVLHAADLVAKAADSVTVVAGRAGAYEDLGLDTIADDDQGLGPLAGLARALRHAREERMPAAGCILLAPCDWLGARASWLTELVEARRPGDLAVAFRERHWEPLPGVYGAGLADLVRAALGSRDRSLRSLLERCSARPVARPEGWNWSVRVNRPEDVTAYLDGRDRS